MAQEIKQVGNVRDKPFKQIKMGDLSGSLFKKVSAKGSEYVTISLQSRIPGKDGADDTYRGFSIFTSQLDALEYIINELKKTLTAK